LSFKKKNGLLKMKFAIYWSFVSLLCRRHHTTDNPTTKTEQNKQTKQKTKTKRKQNEPGMMSNFHAMKVEGGAFSPPQK